MSAPTPPQTPQQVEARLAQLEYWVEQLWCCCCEMQRQVSSLVPAMRYGNTRSVSPILTTTPHGRIVKTKSVSSLVVVFGVIALSGAVGKHKAIASAVAPYVPPTAVPGAVAKAKDVESVVVELTVTEVDGAVGKSKDVTSHVQPLGIFALDGTVNKSKDVESVVFRLTLTPLSGVVNKLKILGYATYPLPIADLDGTVNKSKSVSSVVVTLP